MEPPPPPDRPIPDRPPNLSNLGLQPLPTPDQVTQAVEQGRLDPFSDPRPPAVPPTATPTTGAAGSAGTPGPGITVVNGGGIASAGQAGSSGGNSGGGGNSGAGGRGIAPPPPLPLIRLTGVIQTGGRPEAIVVVGGSQSGSLSLGDRGGQETRLLPAGWRVESIDINAGRLTLRHGPFSQLIKLS